jgi:2'-5' RNA ligase
MHRLFVALRPPVPVRQQLLGLMHGVAGARWQDDDQLHLTLAFIGAVERPLAEDVAAALGRVDGPRPRVALGGAGSFGRKGRPHSLWIGCAPDPALVQLQQRVARALTLAGAAPEARAFHPHVTIARLSGSAGPVEAFLAARRGATFPPFTAEAFLLFESELGQGGASYEAVARYPLTA